ncbi:MAG: gluconate 2-dehydrogenase subunit 3 family protein [bacterium]
MPNYSSIIDRREALRRTALLLGGMVSAPTLAGILAGCEAPRAENGWAPRAMTADQGELVATIAEHILPETDTPGARSVGVHRFIDTMLGEYYTAAERSRFIAGLDDVDARAKRTGARSFVSASPSQQLAVLTELDKEAYPHSTITPAVVRGQDAEGGRTENATGSPKSADSTKRTKATAQPPHFFRTMKELTLLGYYTSQPGATKELQYNPVPGRFDGCVPIAKVGRAWAV